MTAGRWQPTQYLKFENPRLRPALDLLARIPLEKPGEIVDLGCGTGNVTCLLAERWPQARITGVDSSPEMLKKANETPGVIDWVEGDAADWRPQRPVDLLFSNAALHWLDHHDRLFPCLVDCLKPGGYLAVQIPNNYRNPSHTLLAEAVCAGPWKERLEPLLRPTPVASPGFYDALLAPLCDEVEIWETEYQHVLTGDNPVLAWTRGTTLRPLLTALEAEPDLHNGFLAAYGGLLQKAYPAQGAGRVLFPFRRLFILARCISG